jgi:rhamnogalacturonan endolyase
MGYQHWVRSGPDGRFTIPQARPGTWNLYAFSDGAVGEYSRTGIRIEAGKTNALGDVVWEVPHRGTRLAWQIGVPDRTAREFRTGDDYFHGWRWQSLAKDFPNPLVYTVGTSRWEQDWNYFQAGYPDGKGGHVPHRWQIRFTLPEAPAGDATLVLAIASADRATINVQVNEAKPIAVSPAIQGGNALLREGIHAKHCVEQVTIPAGHLVAGANTITLALTSVRMGSSHVMYDHLALELP